MALTRRSVNRMAGSIWPGFVDAMTALLMVLMFVLTIFMIVQFTLQEEISGQESELNSLSQQLASLADALGLERQRNAALEGEVSGLSSTLAAARDEIARQAGMISGLTSQLDDQAAQITSFEAQVAALIAQRDDALDEAAGLSASLEDLESEQARLISEQEALNLALARARDEIDASAEEARLAAARREALEALIAELRADADDTAEALDEAEAARLAEAAAAEALRERLANSQAELTAMTLALEEQRRRAEDTLTLLAAAEAAQDDLDARLAAALSQVEDMEADRMDDQELRDRLAAALAAQVAAEQEAEDALSDAERRDRLLAAANAALAEEEAASADAQREVALLNEQVQALRSQLASLQGVLNEAQERDDAAQVQLDALGSQLNAALAQVAAEQRRIAELEAEARARAEAEAAALADEARDLASYRSEFFGRMRQVLAGREGVRIEGDRFVFSSEVLFPPAEVELSDQGRAQIAQVAGILQDVADEIPPEIDWIIRVDGHTDNTPLAGTGRYRDNWELSQGRALSVVLYMTEQLGFPPERLAAAGFGEFQPVAEGDSPEALAANRRIELKLTEQ